MFAYQLTYGYFNILSNIVNKKMTKNALFLVPLSAVERRERKDFIFFINRGLARIVESIVKIRLRRTCLPGEGSIYLMKAV